MNPDSDREAMTGENKQPGNEPGCGLSVVMMKVLFVFIPFARGPLPASLKER